MAIFGQLEAMPFIDVICVVDQQNGVLVLRSALQGRNVELHLRAHHLLALFVDGFPAYGHERVSSLMGQLCSSSSGEFEFHACPASELKYRFELDLTELLPLGVASQTIAEAELPHAETRFVRSSNVGKPSLGCRAMWSMVRPHLEGGASRRELSVRLSLAEQEVRQMVYHLRAAGLLVPQRLAWEANPAQAAGGRSSAPEPSMLGRLLGALRRMTFRATA